MVNSKNSKKKYYYLVYLDSLNLEELTVRNLYEVVINGLNKKVKYASLLTGDGTLRTEAEGFELEDLTDGDFLEIFDDRGELDIESTARLIVIDFLATGALIVMRREKDMMYEFVDENCKKWIDKIIQGNDYGKGCPKERCGCKGSCGKKL